MFARYKGFSVVFALLMVAFVLTGCGAAKESGQSEGNVDYSSKVKENPIVTITMNNDEKIVIELEPSTAPNTVANFISLVKKGFYDGLIFHRVVPDFMIQGGDPSGNGTGGPDYSIEGEFSKNGFKNDLKHERGVISMARSNDPNSAGSQFFIMVNEASHLDGDYAAFGKVIKGMETVDAIVAAERDGEKPIKDQKMKKVEVDTKGFDYPAPKVIK
ncbi:peptidylprolyl isomerase [Lysinibacillus xylanilyticus]|uniref:Peptidyl-prolyl cis-trans isomerase n=1 Tax=Lysinibacillus xylanilyticus TaxID=582475 RepID=A0A2M9Q1A0_9BACI|nr:peptidylprolyl isomerase [Lysinibacillus xylanilyticus]PJO41853.1 peptidylprolyl isomerase [Lysinibacillus xylanilyticus]